MSYRRLMVTGAGAFADVVRRARQRHGWNQDDLAAASGISRRTISRWETGDITEPLTSQLKALIDATGISAEDVLRSVGLLPDDGPQALFDDPDAQALWNLGERRGWSEEIRLQLIDLWTGRQLRSQAETPDGDQSRTA